MGITKMTKGCDTIGWNKLWRESDGRDQRGMTAEPKAVGGQQNRLFMKSQEGRTIFCTYR